MTNLIPNNNYLLTVDNFSAKKLGNGFNKHYKFIGGKDSKLLFTDGEKTITLWSNHRYREKYVCFITFEKNNNYRVTKNQLNSKSIYVWIKINQFVPNYLKSYSCSISTLKNFIFLIEFYNKINVKKNLKRVRIIKQTFQDYYITRYISEFL